MLRSINIGLIDTIHYYKNINLLLTKRSTGIVRYYYYYPPLGSNQSIYEQKALQPQPTRQHVLLEL